jgi:ABC-type transport system substrate-binding protein
VDEYTVKVTLSQPYAAAERLFDSIAILPQHLLNDAYEKGAMGQIWSVATPAKSIAGLGPYRLKEYVAGQRLVLERNTAEDGPAGAGEVEVVDDEPAHAKRPPASRRAT